MRIATFSALVVAALTELGSAAIADTGCKKLELESQGLSVLMPGTAKKKAIRDKSFIGDITTHEYYVNAGRDSYSVELTDLPGFAVAFSGAETIYDHAKGAFLKTTLSKAVSFSDISLNGVKGKRLVYDTPTKPGHAEMQREARFFLIGHRLYSADTIVEMKGGDEKLRRFFSSLEITK